METQFDVIIIGGSSAGLSAGMALGRAIRNVLIIDSGKPCNRQTPHSHNFITHDGETPAQIMEAARRDVAAYPTVQFVNGTVTNVTGSDKNFTVTINEGDKNFRAGKLIFATGIKDIMPDIKGFAECWGISVIHCPYCHGYEYRNQKTGLFANGDMAFEFSKMLLNWTKQLTLFTNGKAAFSAEQLSALNKHNVEVIEKELSSIEHKDGYIDTIEFKDGSNQSIDALYARLPFVQHTDIPEKLGCEITEQGYIKVDMMNKTTVAGIYACGDNITPMRSISTAVAAGTFAGAAVNKELIEEEF